MTLHYEPELIDYRLKSYHRDGKHLVRGHLIGTKVGDRGWGVSKDTIAENIKQFIGVPFIVSPKEYDPIEHFLVGANYEDQIQKQKVVTKGHLVNIFGPFDYNDGTDDIYYDFEADITDEPVSQALIEGRLPFSTSPYIWPTKDGKPIPISDLDKIDRKNVRDWIPVHEALVTKGTFGSISKISKQCLGPIGQCKQALAGSSADVAKILSSQIYSEKPESHTMDNINPTTQNIVPETPKVPETNVNLNVPNAAPVQPPATNIEEKKTEVSPEVEALQKELAEQKATNEKLLKIHQTGELEKIFTKVDEDQKKAIFKKYVGHKNFDELLDFYNDISTYVLPALKEAKKEEKKNLLAGSSAESETKFPLIGTSGGKTSRLDEGRSITQYLGGPVK